MAKAMLRLCMQDSQRTEDCLVKAYQRPAKRKEITAAREAVNGLCGGEVVLFRAVLGRLFGINAALFLGQLVYWSDKGADPSGWIFKSTDEWESELCLTYKQQRHVRQVLKEAAVVEDRYTPGSARELKFRVKWDALLRVLEKSGENDTGPTCPKGRSPPAQREGPPSQREGPHAQRAAPIQKSTSETTAEEPPKSSRGEDFDASFSTNPPWHPEEAPPPAPHPNLPEVHVTTARPPVQPQPVSPPAAADRNTHPLPQAAAGAHAESMVTPAEDGPHSSFPRSRNLGFPRHHGPNTPDWAAAIAKYDPSAGVLPALFPGFQWEEHPREARRYFKRRRNNDICDRHLALLQYFLETEGGDQVPLWRPPSVPELITRFSEVITSAEQDAITKLENLEARIDEFFEGDADQALSAFSTAMNVAKAPDVEDLKAVLRSGLSMGLRWPILIALAMRGEPIDLSPNLRAAVLAELAEDETAIEVFRNASIAHFESFGFTSDEVDAERLHQQDALLGMRNELRTALGILAPAPLHHIAFKKQY